VYVEISVKKSVFLTLFKQSIILKSLEVTKNYWIPKLK